MKKLIRDSYLFFMTYSVLGFLYEYTWYLLVKHEVVNRGFLQGPYLPIYGLGALLFIYLLYDFRIKQIKICNINITPILVFISIFILSSLIEYFSHFILDEFFDIKLWNYSKEFLNINGRVCLTASLGFALAGTVGLYLVQPFMEMVVHSLPEKYKDIYFFVLLITVLVDLITKCL